MNFLNLIKYIAVISPFMADFRANAQTSNDTLIQKDVVTVADSSLFITKKSRIIFIDSNKLAHDLINDSLLAEFHANNTNTEFTYVSDVDITIQNSKKSFQMGSSRNSFDTLLSHLTKKYLLNYRFKFPQGDVRKKHVIAIYLTYDTDRKFLKIEMKEFTKRKFLIIHLQKIPFW